MRAVLYTRVSSEQQASEGYSLEAQKQACTRFAAEKHLELVEHFEDRGESGTTTQRPEFQQMLELVRSDPTISAVVVHNLDRLARSLRDFVVIRDELKNLDVRLLSVTEDFGDSPTGELAQNIKASVSDWYSQNLSVETRKGKNQKAEHGWYPSVAPLGYLNENKIIVQDDQKAPLIREAFELMATGDYTLKQLASQLTTNGLRSRNGKVLSVSRVSEMIKQPFYRGVFRWQDLEHEGKHEPIVSLELWQRANRTLDGHNRGALRTRKHSHPSKGTLYCRCGRAMSLTLAKGQHLYFFCLRRSDCSEPYVRAQDIGQQVEDLFDQITLPPQTLKQLEEKMSTAVENKEEHRNQMRRRLESRLEALKHERQKLLAAYYADAIPTDLLKQEQDRITNEQATIETQLTTMNEHIAASDALVSMALDLAQDCGDTYRNADTEGKALFVEAFFSRLTVSKGRIYKVRAEEPFDQILQSTLAEQPVRSQTLGGGGRESNPPGAESTPHRF